MARIQVEVTSNQALLIECQETIQEIVDQKNDPSLSVVKVQVIDELNGDMSDIRYYDKASVKSIMNGRTDLVEEVEEVVAAPDPVERELSPVLTEKNTRKAKKQDEADVPDETATEPAGDAEDQA